MNELKITRTSANTPYWDALNEGRLTFQHCEECGNDWLPPRSCCPRCLSDTIEWRTACGHARLVSWVVYHKAYAPGFEGRIPYNVAIVELEEGPRLLTNVSDCLDGTGLQAGTWLEFFTSGADDQALPLFRVRRQAVSPHR